MHMHKPLVGALNRVCHEPTAVREARKQSPNCGAHRAASQRGQEDKPGIDLDNGDSSTTTGVLLVLQRELLSGIQMRL